MIPKLAVFDVDGTLLDDGGHCRPRTRAVLKRLADCGVSVAIATGRPLALAPFTLEEIGPADWAAMGNGAALLEIATGELLRDAVLPDGIAISAISSLREALPGVGFAIETRHAMFEEPGFAKRVPPSPHPEPVDDALAEYLKDPTPIRKLIVFHEEFDYGHDLTPLAEIIASVTDDRVDLQYGWLPIVEMAPHGDHKGVALDVLVDHLGITAAGVIAFGDGLNDLEMLAWAGVGVAMGQAAASVHEAADHVTETNEADGVAVFLEPILDVMEAQL